MCRQKIVTLKSLTRNFGRLNISGKQEKTECGFGGILDGEAGNYAKTLKINVR